MGGLSRSTEAAESFQLICRKGDQCENAACSMRLLRCRRETTAGAPSPYCNDGRDKSRTQPRTAEQALLRGGQPPLSTRPKAALLRRRQAIDPMLFSHEHESTSRCRKAELLVGRGALARLACCVPLTKLKDCTPHPFDCPAATFAFFFNEPPLLPQP